MNGWQSIPLFRFLGLTVHSAGLRRVRCGGKRREGEREKTRMVSVCTIGTSDDNNHDVVAAKRVYLKILSGTKSVGIYYSLDEKSWQLIRLFENDCPASIWMGIDIQCPLGEGTPAVFEDIALTKQSISDFRLGI